MPLTIQVQIVTRFVEISGETICWIAADNGIVADQGKVVHIFRRNVYFQLLDVVADGYLINIEILDD